jgi:hypothetical protein
LRARVRSVDSGEPRSAICALGCLSLGDQVLGDLGLPLQPRQPRLSVHACHLLAGRQPLAHDADYPPVGGRLKEARTTTLARARKDAHEAKKALAEAEKSRRSTDARQWLDLALRKLAGATSAVQDVSDRLEAIEGQHGPVALTRREEQPA